ncbi:MAG: sugar phosphate nucleotidyltransferase [Candidatus Zixiibacteriota bacterium]
MKVIIPVAGIGTRLRPHTHTAPKGLLHVAGKPILGHILDRLKKLDIVEIIFIIGFLGEKIADYVKKNYDFKSRFVYQEHLRGLGFALNLVSPRIIKDEPLLIILGDTIIETNLGSVLKKNQNALGTHWVDDPRRFGIVEMEKGWVKRLVEKPEHPTSHQAIVGVYYITNTSLLKECLNEIIRKNIKTRGEYQLTDALQLMINQGSKFSTFDIEGWYDCGKPETLLETNQHLLQKTKLKRKIPGSVLIPPVYVSPTSKIIDSVVGPFVSVADDAVIRNSIIRNSIVGEEAEINFCLLESSLVGIGAEVNGTFQKLNVGDSSVVGVY